MRIIKDKVAQSKGYPNWDEMYPPCRAWGKYKGFAKPREGEKELARESIRLIRKWKGVLEHPRHSSLWTDMNLPKPGERDQFGGFSF